MVNSFKYLGYEFTTKNSQELQMNNMKDKANRMLNATWRLIRTKKNNIKDRMYLYNTLVRSGCMYGVEVWGCGEIKKIEVLQNKINRMATGVARIHPDV